ncbi:MAG TPA: hypothetical protein VHX42_05200 [Candidatus Babeliales bacterium]|jgi:hypothetical protein|nr:hypothetical protein [Candidatus Babeliales bacterium]
MKLHVVVSLFVVCATGSVMSMEQKNSNASRLNFYLGQKGHIRKYSAENMEYAVQPSDFVGKKITEAVKLNDDDCKAVEKALIDSVATQKTVKVPYTLDNKKFLATITPLTCIKNNKPRNNYFVKVTPDKNVIKISMSRDAMYETREAIK